MTSSEVFTMWFETQAFLPNEFNEDWQEKHKQRIYRFGQIIEKLWMNSSRDKSQPAYKIFLRELYEQLDELRKYKVYEPEIRVRIDTPEITRVKKQLMLYDNNEFRVNIGKIDEERENKIRNQLIVLEAAQITKPLEPADPPLAMEWVEMWRLFNDWNGGQAVATSIQLGSFLAQMRAQYAVSKAEEENASDWGKYQKAQPLEDYEDSKVPKYAQPKKPTRNRLREALGMNETPEQLVARIGKKLEEPKVNKMEELLAKLKREDLRFKALANYDTSNIPKMVASDNLLGTRTGRTSSYKPDMKAVKEILDDMVKDTPPEPMRKAANISITDSSGRDVSEAMLFTSDDNFWEDNPVLKKKVDGIRKQNAAQLSGDEWAGTNPVADAAFLNKAKAEGWFLTDQGGDMKVEEGDNADWLTEDDKPVPADPTVIFNLDKDAFETKVDSLPETKLDRESAMRAREDFDATAAALKVYWDGTEWPSPKLDEEIAAKVKAQAAMARTPNKLPKPTDSPRISRFDRMGTEKKLNGSDKLLVEFANIAELDPKNTYLFWFDSSLATLKTGDSILAFKEMLVDMGVNAVIATGGQPPQIYKLNEFQGIKTIEKQEPVPYVRRRIKLERIANQEA